jgi:hypothetical protein
LAPNQPTLWSSLYIPAKKHGASSAHTIDMFQQDLGKNAITGLLLCPPVCMRYKQKCTPVQIEKMYTAPVQRKHNVSIPVQTKQIVSIPVQTKNVNKIHFLHIVFLFFCNGIHTGCPITHGGIIKTRWGGHLTTT